MKKFLCPIFRVRNLSKAFGENDIFRNVNFEIYKSEILGIIGLSGSGKTTLLNLLCGFVSLDEGEIISNFLTDVNGKDGKYESVFKNHGRLLSMVGFSSQDPSVYPNMTVYENLVYFGLLRGVRRRDLLVKIKELLIIFDLERAVGICAEELSEGMRKRLDIACAMVHDPKVLFLDEPTSNLDFKLRSCLFNCIREVNKRGVTVVFVSHILEEVEEIADRVLVIDDGKIRSEKSRGIEKKFIGMVLK